MGIRFEHNLGDLTSDLRTIATTTQARMVKVVHKNVKLGERIARRLARESSGPHGLNYYKRITGDMTGPLEGEYGPRSGNMIGGGWRHGENTDLPRSADQVGPRFAKTVQDEVDDLFWPGA